MSRMAPCLMFVGDVCGKAEEAMERYVAVLPDARVVDVERWGPDEGQTGVKRGHLQVAGQDVFVMDSDGPHQFTFTPASSLVVEFDDQAQLDGAYAALEEGGEALMPLQAYDFSPRFAWVQDRYGVSWQLILATG